MEVFYLLDAIKHLKTSLNPLGLDGTLLEEDSPTLPQEFPANQTMSPAMTMAVNGSTLVLPVNLMASIEAMTAMMPLRHREGVIRTALVQAHFPTS